ncbi:nucleoside deaminase [Proteus cibarius]|uniref:nucleoside deaminase n=1 Tax=Proteus terrae TaxID=1574161 RepID=UPI0018C50546|nr:nucleoside deaminase [Proteus terrae]MBG6037917.1 nucleoside deaminase [Proteus terrae subsp. cibarius]
MSDNQFIQQAISLAMGNVKMGGRPFGAVIVNNGQVIASAVNQILTTNDPTAHAELLALREAGKVLGRPKLDDCVVYASGQPCPMCLAAMRMAGITKIFYAYSNADAEPYGLSTAHIAKALRKEPEQQEGLQFTQIKTEDETQPRLYQFWSQQS